MPEVTPLSQTRKYTLFQKHARLKFLFFYLRNLQDEGEGRQVRAGAHGVVFMREGNPATIDGPSHRVSRSFVVVFVFPVDTCHDSIIGYFLQMLTDDLEMKINIKGLGDGGMDGWMDVGPFCAGW